MSTGKKSNIPALIGVGVIALIVIYSPIQKEKDGESFTDFFGKMGTQQSELANKLTDKAVSKFEGVYVKESEEDGSNWSIPNILRKLFNIED